MQSIVGLHHVTAIVSNAQRTLDFYTGVLGLRFVKRTINFDDPGSFHLYFGDDAGSPGTILTFFAWPGATRGSVGAGETLSIAFSVPAAALGFWSEHLKGAGLAVERAESRFDQQVLRFTDPDGIRLELVGDEQVHEAKPAREASIPAEHAVRGFFGVTLAEAELERTASILGAMGFDQVAKTVSDDGSRFRFAASGTALGRHVDVLVAPRTGVASGRTGAGTIHHIAFRNAEDASQLAWRAHLAALSVDVTPVMDRTYFHSVYFHEPGGVLFELATDPPGFTLDEPAATLGESLKLPPWLEPRRTAIEKHLPPLELRKAKEAVR